jgi:HK97 family phage prohead protease
MKKDYINNIEGAERRFFNTEVRMDEESRKVTGYAAVFEKESNDLGGFVEVIERGAFDDVLEDDAMALFNHDSNFVLARNNRTLKLSVDKVGLRYEFDSPNTTAGNDLLENLRLGNIDTSSFAFQIDKDGDSWEKRGDIQLRTIKKFKRLFDVSPVTYAAYPDTSVALRSMPNNNNSQIVQMRHRLIKIKNKIKIG